MVQQIVVRNRLALLQVQNEQLRRVHSLASPASRCRRASHSFPPIHQHIYNPPRQISRIPLPLNSFSAPLLPLTSPRMYVGGVTWNGAIFTARPLQKLSRCKRSPPCPAIADELSSVSDTTFRCAHNVSRRLVSSVNTPLYLL